MSEDKDKKVKMGNGNGNANGNGAEAAAPADTDTEKLKAELDKAKSVYLYLLADFDNYRKNAVKERSELMKYGSERLIREFLGVFDNFERALEMEVKDGNWNSFRDGVQMIAGELKSLLQRAGVEEVK